MVREIRGIVQKNPVLLEQCCVFLVEQEKGAYVVVSTERQADKDNIFVEQGQEICIKGSLMETDSIKGILLTENAKIVLSRRIDDVLLSARVTEKYL